MDRRAFVISGSAALAAGFSVPTSATAQQVIRTGSTPTGMPFTFLDTKTNKLDGISVDVMNAVARDAKFAVEMNAMQFSTLIPSLTTNRIDIIVSSMFITEPRKQVINFSNPICTYGEAMAVQKSDSKAYERFSDLQGQVVGAQLGGAYVEPLKKSGVFSEVKVYDSFTDLMLDANSGRIKAAFADRPLVGYSIAQGLFPNLRIVESYKSTLPGTVGFGFRKSDTDLLNRFNASLETLRASGELARIFVKWGFTQA